MLIATAGSVTPILPPRPSNTKSAATATHTCLVGADGLTFIPSQITASVGDIIEYRFFPQKHSVARAAFGNNLACVPYEDSGHGLVGFWSGFHPISAVASNPPIYLLLINDTEPVFFYCSSLGACQEGMVGVINANTTFTLEAQLSYALNTSISFSPLDGFPSEVLESKTTSTSPTTTSTISANTPIYPSSSLSSSSIAGIVIGSFVAILILAASLYQFRRCKRRWHKDSGSSRKPNMNQRRFKTRDPTASEPIHPDGIVYHPWPGVKDGANQPASVPAVGDSTTYRFMTPDDFTAQRGSAGVVRSHHLGDPDPIYAGRWQGLDDSSPASSSAITADELRMYTSLAHSAGPHELPAELPESSDATTTTTRAVGSPRPFSFTESDRGWRPNDGELGSRK